MPGYRETGKVLIAIGQLRELGGLDQMPAEIVRSAQMLQVCHGGSDSVY